MAAIEQCCVGVPDLVLLDMRLPDIHGVEVCRRIKATLSRASRSCKPRRQSPVAQDRARALDGGADGFLMEPIEPEVLQATARGLLRLRGAEQAVAPDERKPGTAGRGTHPRADRGQPSAGSRGRRAPQDRGSAVACSETGGVGQLTGGIAHDFNNLLAVIVGSMEMIRAAFESDGELPRAKIMRLLQAIGDRDRPRDQADAAASGIRAPQRAEVRCRHAR